MADGRRRRDDQGRAEDNTGKTIATAIGAIAAGIGIGAAIYAGYKEYSKKQKKAEKEYMYEESGSFSDVPHPPTDYMSLAGEDDVYGTATPSVTRQSANFKCTAPLTVELLQNYHESYAEIPEHDMLTAKNVVDDIKRHIFDYFQTKCSDMKISQMKDTGSCKEGLKVICPDEFDVMFTLQLDGGYWQQVRCEEHDAFYEIRKRYTLDQTSPYDKYTINGFLCPRKLQRHFYGEVQRALNGFQKYFTTLESHGPAITLKVRYDEGRVLYIDFVPGVAIGGILLVPKPHKQVQLHEKTFNEYNRFWRQSFSNEEFDFLNGYLPSWYCHLTVLKIVKAIRLNCKSQFGMFSSYIYKTLLMHMLRNTSEEDMEEWEPEYLLERFVDYLKRLQSCLSDKYLPHYFLPGVNLLDEVSPATCENLYGYIDKRLRKGLLGDLLKREYTGIR